MGWLHRIYGFPKGEIAPAFDADGFLPREFDPKTSIALENIEAFPVDVNTATRDTLLRVPDIGPISARRILQN